MKAYERITDLIGKTPLLKLNNYSEENKLGATLLAKLEYFNPAGSVKDRIALAMIDEAEEKGLLKPALSSSSLPAEIRASACLLWQLPEDIGSF